MGEPEEMDTVDGVTTSQNNYHTDGAGTSSENGFLETGNTSTARITRLGRFRQRWRSPNYRRNVRRTVWLGFALWGLGFVTGQRGPAFLDLQIITRTDMEGASFFLTAHAAGYIIGSMAAGIIYDLLNKSLLLLLSLAGLGASAIAMPWCSPYWLMIAIHFVMAFCGGCVDTGGNAELLHLWGKEGEVAMQFLHFAFAFGGVMGPLAIAPFLTPPPPEEKQDEGSILTTIHINSSSIGTSTSSNNNISTATLSSQDPNRLGSEWMTSLDDVMQSWVTSGSNDDALNKSWQATSASPGDAMSNNVTSLTDVTINYTTSTPPPLPLTTSVHYAFLISGGTVLLITVPFLIQLFSDHSQKPRQRRQQEDNEEEEEQQKRKKKAKQKRQQQQQPMPMALFLFVVGLLCIFYLLHCSVEDSSLIFLTTFAVKQLGWSKSDGARLTAVMWATFASFRFICIFLVHVLSSVKLLGLSCLSLVIAQSAMLAFAAGGVDTGVWIAAMLVGASVAAIFPAGFSWMQEELVHVTGRVTSSIFVSSSLGSMLMPILMGFLMQEVSPMWYSYLLTLLSSMSLAVFLFLLALARLCLQKR